MRKVLVVSVNWLGDVVFSTPVFRALKAAHPLVRVCVLAVPRVKEVLELCPGVDEVIVHDEGRGFLGAMARLPLALLLRARKFDAVLFLRPSLSGTFMAWTAGIPERVGFPSGPWTGLLTRVADDAGCDQIHRSDVYLRVVEAMGLKVRDRSCRLEAGSDAREGVLDKLRARGLTGDERLVVIHTGGNWGLKQWPEGSFADLTGRLIREAGVKVVLSGGRSDIERVRRIAALSGVAPVILAGETTLKEMAALFKKAYVVISADSGPLHVASAVGANVLGLFGPTHPDITGPRGQGRIKVLRRDTHCNRAPCYYLECPDNVCMKSLTVDDVIQTFKVLKT